jgi:hypothetical protein
MSTKSKFSRLHVPPTQRALGPREPQEPVMGISDNDINSPVNTPNKASKLGGNIPGFSPGARSDLTARSRGDQAGAPQPPSPPASAPQDARRRKGERGAELRVTTPEE